MRLGFGLGIASNNASLQVTGLPPVFYEEFLLDQYSSNLLAVFPLQADSDDVSGNSNDPVSTTSVVFSDYAVAPYGFANADVGEFNGSSSYLKLDNGSGAEYTNLSVFTIACWFQKKGGGVAINTSGGTDGFNSANPIVPLVTKGVGESDLNNKDCNWFLGINKVDNGSTYRLAGDFEHMEAVAVNNHKVVGTTDIQEDQWYFGALTWDGTDLKIILNGVVEATVTPTGFHPRSDSTQMGAVGTTIKSTGAVGGFFDGCIIYPTIWDTALDPAALLALYAKGNSSLRGVPVPEPVPVVDNAIVHGDDFANWAVDVGSTADATGITIVQGAGDQAVIDIDGLEVVTEYWMKINVAAMSASAGNIRILALADTGNEITGVSGALYNLTAAVGTQYFKVLTGPTQATPGKTRLTLKHASAAAGQSIRMDEIVLYPIPERSAAKLGVFGDREGGYNPTTALATDTAFLSADADMLNALQIGDSAGTSNPFTINDNLKNGLVGRGGKIYPIYGNHDYDADRENEWDDYYDTNGYNSSERYYWRELGNCFIAFYNDNPEESYNAGGYNATTAAAQEAAVEFQAMKTAAAASTKPIKIFMIHRAVYSSHSSGGDASNRMDFAGAGFDIVVQGHYHGLEHLIVGGVNYITCAKGGNSHHGWGSTNGGSVWKEDDQTVNGYVKIHDGTTACIMEFFDTDNQLLHRLRVDV